MKYILSASLAMSLLLFLTAWWAAPETISLPQGPISLLQGQELLTLSDSGSSLQVQVEGQIQEMSMEEYLRGVLRAEMPASFPLEALKAQAVSARTYTLYRMQNGGSENHPQADACDDVTCCKAYLSAGGAREAWGVNFGFYEQKIQQAVAQTDGEVVLYGGAPILAAFHSSSCGRTQNVEDVWLNSLPYLRGVESREEEDSVPNYYSVSTFPAAEFKQLFLAAYPQAKLEGNIDRWFRGLCKNDNGLVTALTIGSVTVKGTELRSLLGLRSASFELETDQDSVSFHVTGYGHGVGLSQYGASAMAKEGADYREILQWYYTGVEIGPYIAGET